MIEHDTKHFNAVVPAPVDALKPGDYLVDARADVSGLVMEVAPTSNGYIAVRLAQEKSRRWYTPGHTIGRATPKGLLAKVMQR